MPGITITVNGARREIQAAGDTPLLYVLRNDLELSGPQFGCGLSQCGSCSVLVDGKEARSCVLPLSRVAGKRDHHSRGSASAVGQPAGPAGCGSRADAAPGAAGVDRRAGAAVRLLPERHDDQGHASCSRPRRHRTSSRSRPRSRAGRRRTCAAAAATRPSWTPCSGRPPSWRKRGRRWRPSTTTAPSTCMARRCTRRQFVKTGGALVVGFSLVGRSVWDEAAEAAQHSAGRRIRSTPRLPARGSRFTPTTRS